MSCQVWRFGKAKEQDDDSSLPFYFTGGDALRGKDALRVKDRSPWPHPAQCHTPAKSERTGLHGPILRKAISPPTGLFHWDGIMASNIAADVRRSSSLAQEWTSVERMPPRLF